MSPTNKQRLKDAVEHIEDLDCGDHSCKYAKLKLGMRTNGGCRCARNKGDEVEFYLTMKLLEAICIIEEMEKLHGRPQ